MAEQTTIAAALQDKIDAKAALKTVLNRMAIPINDTHKLSEYAGLLTANLRTWTRPADWLQIDNLVTDGEQKIVGLHAVYPTVNTAGMTNAVAIQVTGDHTIDWGDGVVENFSSNAIAEHIYDYDDLAGTECTRGYRQAIVTITPQSGQNITSFNFGKKHSSVVFGRISSQWLDVYVSGTELNNFRFYEASYPNLLESVKVYQTTNKCTSCVSMFNSCYSLQYLDLSSFNTASVTSMANMFYNCFSLQYLDLSSFNTASVTNMSVMFGYCYSLQYLDLSSFNTASVTSMYAMFFSCYSLQYIDLSSFNTASVTNMQTMFYNCYSLQYLDLSSFNTASVTSMANMFYNCFSLQYLDLSSFNTASVTSMANMFFSCYSLQYIDLSSFNTASVTNMSVMFGYCYSLEFIDLSYTLLNAVISQSNFNRFTDNTTSLIKCRLPQAKWSFSVANNPLSATELNLLFCDLEDLTATDAQTLTITGCTGAATCDKTIATSKNWIIVG